MDRKFTRSFSMGVAAAAMGLGLWGCSDSGKTKPASELPHAVTGRLEAVRAQFPSAQTQQGSGANVRIYGPELATGATPADAADNFRRTYAKASGLGQDDLAPPDQATGRGLAANKTQGIGLMHDLKTGQPKFWLYRYQQKKDGVPVFRAGLHTLVRNDGSNQVVWASSNVRDVSRFSATAGLRARTPDLDRSLRALRGLADIKGKPLDVPKALVNVSTPEPVVFAGGDDAEATPRMAMQYTADSQPFGKWHFVADAATGEVLHVESQIVFATVNGKVTGKVTQGDAAMECAPEIERPLAFAEVDGQSSEVAYTDATGAYVLTTSASSALNVTSLMSGQYFDVVNYAGALENLVSSVTPPGPANFLHDSAATDPLIIAQSNGYAQSNDMRSFLLKYIPTYPVIATQTNFPVNVNLDSSDSGGICPGNAYYSYDAINFCIGSSDYGNTSFAGIIHHEYGHHIVNCAGSGQGAYGEGMSDAVSVLFSGEHKLALGFFLNDCTNPLRDAQNTCQYSATSCSSCGSESHDCGQLLAGIVWDIRQAMAASHPDTFADIVNALILNSILLHTGSSITPQIAIDLITLDDNDGTIANGSPHYAEICAGFAAHGMSCPALSTDLNVTPTTTLASEGPVGGPFAPASATYTLTNLGPNAPIAYQVAPVSAAPWMTISNATGQLQVGQTVQVTVAIDQAAAALLAKGTYTATVQFTNLTNGIGSATRTAQLKVGVPLPIYSESFDVGTGSFTIGNEASNLWHVTSSCASAQPGHSTPKSLYFGIDSSCSYANSQIDAGTATSSSISVLDTSEVRLRFKYFLQNEGGSTWDQAKVMVSVNNGSYVVVASSGQGGLVLQNATGSWLAADADITSLFSGLTNATMRVRVSFDTVDSYANNYTGFLVDDVQVLAFAGSTVNQAPTVNAGPDQAIVLPASATLAGTASDDGLPTPPGALTTTWSKVSGPGTVTFADPSQQTTTATFSAPGSYVLRLTASDSALASTDDVTITVTDTPVNQAPTANAGPDQTITLPATASLVGSASDDGLPNPPGTLTTTWSMVSGPGTVTFANANALATTATFSVSGSYVLRLTASDSLLSATDDVAITVNAAPPINQAPTVNAGPDQTITLPAAANLVGTASDDGLPNPPGTLTMTWSTVSGPGTVTFANASALSTTATFTVAGSYVLRLTASDSALSASDELVVTVSGAPPVNQAPIVDAGADQTITLPAGAVLAGTATDDGLPNPPGTLVVTWSTLSGPGSVTFANASALSTAATFPTSGSYVLRLTVYDGEYTTTDDITVTVLPQANLAPIVNAGPDQTITLPAVANLTGSATDDGLPNPPAKVTTTWSKVSGPGTVTFANASALSTTATFSVAGNYVLRLTGNDSALSATDDIAITVIAAPVNQAPVVNAGPDQTITLPAVANLTGSATDDGLPNPPAKVTTTWSKVSGPGTVTFANASALSTTATFSAAGSYVLRLTGNDGALSATDDVAITVNPSNATPCSGLCSNPINFSIKGSFSSGNLGTGSVCYQTTSPMNGGNCGNFVSGRILKVNGTTEPCTGGNWSSIPLKRNGGYCIQTTSGNYPWAYFTAW